MSGIPESVRQEVLARDEWHCVAPIVDLDGAGQCHDKYGRAGYNVPISHLEPDHVGEGRMGKAAKSIPSKLVTLCPGHHRGVGEHGFGGSIWATAHRPLLREYLRAKEPAVYGSDQLETVELSWAAFSARERIDAGL